jgi:hypothetical protein
LAAKAGRGTRWRVALITTFTFSLLALSPAAAIAASATTGEATLVRSSTATLNAQIDPSGDPGITECHFQYVTQAAFEATGFTDLSSGGSVICSGSPPYTSPTAVSAAIGGLKAGIIYRFRVIALTTSSGTLEGTAQSFTTVHGEIGSFGKDGSGGSSFGEIRQLGLDEATRRLYVVDREVPGIWGFGISSGAPPFPPIAGFDPLVAPAANVHGIAVDNSALSSAGSVYYISNPAFGFSPAGAQTAEFKTGEAGTAAVDSGGHIWVEGTIGGFGERLDEFAASGGGPIESVSRSELPVGLGGGLEGIAMGTGDELFALAKNRRTVWVLSPESGYREARLFIPDPGHVLGNVLAFDKRSHHLYIASESAIAEYDASGTLVDEFGKVPGAQYSGLAVDPANHEAYVSDQSIHKVRVFAAGAPFAALSLADPSPLANTTATLHATVNPEGSALGECRFQYVTETAFDLSGFSDLSSGGEAECEPPAGSIPPDSSDHAVSAAVAGLEPHTAYRYRLVVANKAGPTSAEDSFTTSGPPAVETTGASLPSPRSAVLGGRVDPELAATNFHFEYGTQGPCDANPCASTPEVELARNEVQQILFGGNSAQKFKLSFAGEETPELAFDASAAQVQVALEGLAGIGAGNVSVAGGRSLQGDSSTYTVTFVGALAGADVASIGGAGNALVGARTPIQGGLGNETKLVAAKVGGLEPATTYHYRVVAANGNPDGTSSGGDITFTTAAASPPGNGGFAGPPEGSDRAYELVSIADSGGNPTAFALAFSGNGERAVYQVSGGTPISPSGTFFSQLLAERREGEPHTGDWEQVNLTPRSLFEPSAPDWLFFPDTGLERFVGYNLKIALSGNGDVQNLWRITPPEGPYTKLASSVFERSSEFFEADDAAEKVVAAFKDDLDPAHPADRTKFHLYDVSSGAPHLLDLLPAGEGGGVAACGVSSFDPAEGEEDGIFGYNQFDPGKRRWLSGDGELAIFPSRGDSCSGPVELYVREIEAGQTKLISGPVVSGPQCSAAFLRATGEAAFFWTQSRLVAQDSEPAGCNDASPGAPGTLNGDVYRYDFGDGSLDCVTCAAGRAADVVVSGGNAKSALVDIGVSQDGSAVYFASPHRLLPGAARDGGVYRVEVESGKLEYVAPGVAKVGDELTTSAAVSADGSVLVFRSNDARLDPQGGTINGGFAQYYRYDERDRSLVCVSCPADGSRPRGEVVGLANAPVGAVSYSYTFNGSPLSSDGSVFAFDTPSALVGADQNTTPPGQNPQHGQDVYEWRGGRAMLISDGLQNWPGGGALGFSEAAPEPVAVSPDGKNVFFFEAAQLTPDAPDPYRRLYDARIGGGFRFPVAPGECDLDACQGIAQGAPAETAAGTSTAVGVGNVRQGKGSGRCPKGRRAVRRHGKRRCVKPRHGKHKRRARR